MANLFYTNPLEATRSPTPPDTTRIMLQQFQVGSHVLGSPAQTAIAFLRGQTQIDMSSDRIRMILEIMLTYSDDLEASALGIHVLSNLSQSCKDLRDDMARDGGVKIICATIDKYMHYADIIIKGSTLLMNLAKDSDQRRKWVHKYSKKFREAIFQMLPADELDEALPQLIELDQSAPKEASPCPGSSPKATGSPTASPKNPPVKFGTGVSDPVCDATVPAHKRITNENYAAKVICSILGLLCQLAHNDLRRALHEEDICSRVIEVWERYKKHHQVCLLCLVLLKNLSVGSHRYSTAVNNSITPEFMFKALEVHQGNEDILVAATSLLSVLSAVQEICEHLRTHQRFLPWIFGRCFGSLKLKKALIRCAYVVSEHFDPGDFLSDFILETLANHQERRDIVFAGTAALTRAFKHDDRIFPAIRRGAHVILIRLHKRYSKDRNHAIVRNCLESLNHLVPTKHVQRWFSENVRDYFLESIILNCPKAEFLPISLELFEKWLEAVKIHEGQGAMSVFRELHTDFTVVEKFLMAGIKKCLASMLHCVYFMHSVVLNFFYLFTKRKIQNLRLSSVS